ncbi:hypothetical protein GCM10011508_02160 [Flavobacterium lutivivi]|nr:hypothetical protein GCM10011508_02160 [Flavobacterium lutivivi]
MKKIVLVLLLAISFVGFSQEKKEMQKERLTNEQRAELESKKMKLDLDLNDKQTAEVKKLLLEQQNKGDEVRKTMKAKKESGVKPSQDEIFKMKNELLDRQIAFKGEMKKLLTPEQYAKWEATREAKKDKMKDHFKQRKEGGPKKRKPEAIEEN